MNMRSSTSKVTFSKPFSLSAFSRGMPSGEYEIVVEEERLQGLTFEAWRRTATYMATPGRGVHAGRAELHPVSDAELREALRRDGTPNRDDHHSEAALSPQEDLT